MAIIVLVLTQDGDSSFIETVFFTLKSRRIVAMTFPS